MTTGDLDHLIHDQEHCQNDSDQTQRPFEEYSKINIVLSTPALQDLPADPASQATSAQRRL
jgi:hypothetical protein